jgi:hypothetical protein
LNFHIATLLFVALKLTGYIAWPWLGVLAPSLIVLGIAVGALLLSLYVLWKHTSY